MQLLTFLKKFRSFHQPTKTDKWDYLWCPIIEIFFLSCFDIGEVPRSPGKWNWNRLSFLPFIFSFEQCAFRSHSINSKFHIDHIRAHTSDYIPKRHIIFWSNFVPKKSTLYFETFQIKQIPKREKFTFQKGNISFWSKPQKCTFHFNYIPKRAHFILKTSQKEQILFCSHSNLSTVQKEHILF